MTQGEAMRFVEQLFQYTDTNDWAKLAMLFHADIEYERPGYPDVMPLKGRDKVMEYFKSIRKVKSGIHTTTQVFVNDDAIICTGEFSGVSKTGQPLSARYADYYQLKEGVVIRRISYFV